VCLFLGATSNLTAPAGCLSEFYFVAQRHLSKAFHAGSHHDPACPGLFKCGLFCKRSQWTKTSMDSIDWNGFSAAFQSCFKQGNFAFKFCSPLLPTGKNLHRNYDHQCPACNVSQECNGHLFQCTAVFRQGWRSKTTSALCKRLDTTTNPVLSDIMITLPLLLLSIQAS
jgi:hypothetical protein